MKGLLFILLLVLTSSMLWAQNITGKVISLSDNQPIANATVKLLLSNKVIITDKGGKFNLIKNVNYAIDTLLVSYLGYLSFKTPTNQLPKNGIIGLKVDVNYLNEVNIGSEKKKVFKTLNPFQYSSIKYNLLLDTSQAFVTSKYPIAKQFIADVDSFKLESIYIGRYIETVPEEDKFLRLDGNITKFRGIGLTYNLKKYSKRAIFNIYIVYPDAQGNPLPLNQSIKIPVNLTSADVETEIKLETQDIKLKQRNFYIAIEWLPILPNQNYSLGKRGHPRIYREFTLPVRQNIKDDGSPQIAMVYEIGFEPLVSIYNVPIAEAAKKFAWIDNKWVEIEKETGVKFSKEIALAVKISY